MPKSPHVTLKVAKQTESPKIRAMPARAAELFSRGDVSLWLWTPDGADTQAAHERDEFYFVCSGVGQFRRAAEEVAFETGDVLFVPAGVQHKFLQFSEDFSTWVVFFGPKASL